MLAFKFDDDYSVFHLWLISIGKTYVLYWSIHASFITINRVVARVIERTNVTTYVTIRDGVIWIILFNDKVSILNECEAAAHDIVNTCSKYTLLLNFNHVTQKNLLTFQAHSFHSTRFFQKNNFAINIRIFNWINSYYLWIATNTKNNTIYRCYFYQ